MIPKISCIFQPSTAESDRARAAEGAPKANPDDPRKWSSECLRPRASLGATSTALAATLLGYAVEG